MYFFKKGIRIYWIIYEEYTTPIHGKQFNLLYINVSSGWLIYCLEVWYFILAYSLILSCYSLGICKGWKINYLSIGYIDLRSDLITKVLGLNLGLTTAFFIYPFIAFCVWFDQAYMLSVTCKERPNTGSIQDMKIINWQSLYNWMTLWEWLKLKFKPLKTQV